MLALTRDADWAERLAALATRGGWPYAAMDCVPHAPTSEVALIVLDRREAGATPARTVAGLRKLYPSVRLALACTDAELGSAGAALGVSCGVDDVLAKSWADDRLLARLSALRDAALADAVLLSMDGTLKAERRSRRAYAAARGKWKPLELAAPEFALLWALLSAAGAPVSRERLLDALRAVSGRALEAEAVSRRILSLRRALKPWKGRVESVRGGFYRLLAPI